ncbi:hypothetical protein PVAP13_6NG077330 [Panicum virgatum]|uniref:Uncharacterized protein n=1 Tax=Panicum virgatum TaxID=38727 RepID=A0A8T0QV60_PANVG|nr:hypothetical protein PVAP13_6NG077330 [Panicum virgatum]
MRGEPNPWKPQTGSSHPFAETKQKDPTEPTPTNPHTLEIIWGGGEEAHPSNAGEDSRCSFTGVKEGKHNLTPPQLRSPVQHANNGELAGTEAKGQKQHPAPWRRRGSEN